MNDIIDSLHALFAKMPEIALFASLAAGYWLGKLKIGSFQLGGVAGSLLAATIVGLVGVEMAPVLKNVLFALFIYAVGYECGPQFFRSLNRKSLREIVLAACLAATALTTVVVCAKAANLNKGLAAGLAAGGLTQSAIIGTAGSAIEKLDLPRDDAGPQAPGQGGPETGQPRESIRQLENDVAVGYAVTYVFGSFGAIIICCNILPWFMRRSIREDALAAETKQQAGVAAAASGQELAVRPITGRVYRLRDGFSATVEELEGWGGDVPLAVESIKRGGVLQKPEPGFMLRGDDLVLVVGQREAILRAMPDKGTEVRGVPDMEFRMAQREVVIASPQVAGRTVAEIRETVSRKARHGVFALGLIRKGARLPLDAGMTIDRGDSLLLYGSEHDVGRAAAELGYAVVPDNKTDFVYLGVGLVVGLLAGMLTLKWGALVLTLGSGGGALLAGLLFGWFRSRHPRIGAMPTGAVQLLKDMGLAGFVAVIGLTTGKQAIDTIIDRGLSLFLIGLVVTVVPMLVCILIGKYILRYDNVAVFAGALSGSRSANPAFGQVLAQAGNAVPTVPFAITYALANVFLTLLGPVIVALV